MSFDLTFYTKKFTKEQVLKTISKLPNLEFANLQIGDSWFDYDNQGDNFTLDGQEIYV